jgi:hypothetical protein
METAMSPVQGEAIVSHLKKLMTALARKVAAEIGTPDAEVRLPTEAQLNKMGPQSPFTRGSPQRHGW